MPNAQRENFYFFHYCIPRDTTELYHYANSDDYSNNENYNNATVRRTTRTTNADATDRDPKCGDTNSYDRKLPNNDADTIRERDTTRDSRGAI